VVSREAVRALVADSVTLSVVEGEGSVLRMLAHEGYADDVVAPWTTYRVDDSTPNGEAVRSGRPVVLASRDEITRAFPQLAGFVRETGDRAWLCYPLQVVDRTVGVLSFGFRHEAPDPAVVELGRAVAGQCALALDRARLSDAEHDVALALQHALLPDVTSACDGVEVAARYRAGQAGLDVGGDWYDCFPLPGHRVGLVVGDVVGPGVHAAAVMGQLRTALSAVAASAGDAGAALDRLEAYGPRIPLAQRFATAAYTVLDPVAGTLEYACAGHPPPLLVDASGAVTVLAAGRSRPLFVAPRATARPCATEAMPPASRLVLYTDGLVERAGQPLTEGLSRLSAAVARHSGLGLADQCDAVLADLLGDVPHADDVALFVIGRRRD
jgi:serine phosphatase RsbU (regulator of sigma subunit)